MRVSGVPVGFRERRFDTGEVELNYVVGEDRGPPILFVPSQMESWEGYKLVMPELSRRHQVYVVDVRGHGKSTHTPGNYTIDACGRDLNAFLLNVIGRPAIVSGCSSGGILAAWLAARVPEMVLAVVCEDPAILVAAPGRMEKEIFMREIFELAARWLGKPEGRDLQGFMSAVSIPQKGRETFRRVPAWAVRLLLFLFRVNARLRPDHPYDVPLLPFFLRAQIKFFSEYDPDFSRASADGSLCAGYDPDELLRQIECPFLLLQASWFRHPTYGLIGACDEQDLERIRSLVGDFHYRQVESGHQIHYFKPRAFLREVFGFLQSVKARSR